MSDMECYGIPEEYVDCEDEYDPPYECEENLDTTCCECGGKHFITPNECFPWRCINRDCKHEMCSDCKEVDCDGMTVIDSDDEDHFVIQDPDAEKGSYLKILQQFWDMEANFGRNCPNH